MSDSNFEHLVNWRIAKAMFDNPKRHFLPDANREIPQSSSETTVYFSHVGGADVIQVRDWLHEGHVSGPYVLLGCWSQGEATPRFCGLKVRFADPVDAAFCKLRWNDGLRTI